MFDDEITRLDDGIDSFVDEVGFLAMKVDCVRKRKEASCEKTSF